MLFHLDSDYRNNIHYGIVEFEIQNIFNMLQSILGIERKKKNASKRPFSKKNNNHFR